MLIFEYMEAQVITASIMLVIVGLLLNYSGSSKTYKLTTSIKLLLILAFILPFIASLYSISISNENIEYFKSGKELECTNDKSKFLVSESSNWILKDDNFIKDSLMIRADNCELYK
jgi:hypothetical protein